VTAPLAAKVRASRLVHGSAWILVGMAAQAVLGFAFWSLGARIATSAELGRASALFTAIQFVGFVAGLGLTVALARHAVARTAESDALFTWAVGASVLASFATGLSYLAVTDTAATRLVTGSAGASFLFCAYAAGIGVGLLADVRLMAARRWRWLVGRYVLTGLVRLPLVALDVGVEPDRWLYHLMLAPLAVSGVLSLPLLRLVGAGSMRRRRPVLLGPVARYAGVNWLATLASQAPQYVLPLVVAQSVAVVGERQLLPGLDRDRAWSSWCRRPSRRCSWWRARTMTRRPLPRRRPRDRARRMRFSLGLAIPGLGGCGAVAGQLAATVALGDEYERLARYLPGADGGGDPMGVHVGPAERSEAASRSAHHHGDHRHPWR
jgi:hypothetical protein